MNGEIIITLVDRYSCLDAIKGDLNKFKQMGMSVLIRESKTGGQATITIVYSYEARHRFPLWWWLKKNRGQYFDHYRFRSGKEWVANERA